VWQKIRAGLPAALILGGIPLLFGSKLAGGVLIAIGIVFGLLVWLHSSGRISYEIRRSGSTTEDADRRELLSLAQAVAIELETCRIRLARANEEHTGWFNGQGLPAETFNSRWTRSAVTADQTEVNASLQAFYTFADDLNHRMVHVVAAQFNAIGHIYQGGEQPLLGWETIEPAREGIKRVTEAQEQISGLIARLARNA
jgi:hypothetical protein